MLQGTLELALLVAGDRVAGAGALGRATWRRRSRMWPASRIRPIGVLHRAASHLDCPTRRLSPAKYLNRGHVSSRHEARIPRWGQVSPRRDDLRAEEAMASSARWWFSTLDPAHPARRSRPSPRIGTGEAVASTQQSVGRRPAAARAGRPRRPADPRAICRGRQRYDRVRRDPRRRRRHRARAPRHTAGSRRAQPQTATRGRGSPGAPCAGSATNRVIHPIAVCRGQPHDAPHRTRPSGSPMRSPGRRRSRCGSMIPTIRQLGRRDQRSPVHRRVAGHVPAQTRTLARRATGLGSRPTRASRTPGWHTPSCPPSSRRSHFQVPGPGARNSLPVVPRGVGGERVGQAPARSPRRSPSWRGDPVPGAARCREGSRRGRRRRHSRAGAGRCRRS